MADARLGGSPSTQPLGLSGSNSPAINNCGHITSYNVTWGAAFNGIGSFTAPSSIVKIGATPGDPSLLVPAIYRAFLQFEIPSNLYKVDENPQLKVRCSSRTGDGKIAITSVDYTSFATPWNTWNATAAWKSAYRTNAKAYYENDGDYFYTLSVGASYHTITLSANELAKSDCNNRRYVVVGLMEYTYDRAGTPFSAPPSSNTFVIDGPGDAYPPQLILQKPWFVNNRGAEPKYTQLPTYVIEPYNVGINQHARSVPQLPFSTAIKGPISLRGKNVPYKVTT
jgi:hypothetical protein